MTDHVQPTWAGAPDWANYWAADSDGYAYWYRDKPTFDYDHEYGGIWLRPWEAGESDRQFNNDEIKFDASWPPEGFDDWDIDWDKTLRSRP